MIQTTPTAIHGTGAQVALWSQGAGGCAGQRCPHRQPFAGLTLEIGTEAFRVEDILLLSDALNLTETSAATLGALDRSYGNQCSAVL
ncbi:MAG: hypothetical protein R3C44_00350 [Chloroflexota bacterium]